MQTAPPLLSIIMPTHRRPVLLERALASIKSQPDAPRYEIIVISDEADRDTDAVCHRLLGPDDMRIRRNGAPGPAASRNLGIELASGRYIMFLDDDDAWQPGFLSALARLKEIEENRFVFFDCLIVTENRAGPQPVFISALRLDTTGKLDDLVFLQNQLHMSCIAFPRAVIGSTRFDPFMRAYEDWDFMLAIFRKSMPTHVALSGPIVHEIADDSSDRRGDSRNATNENAIMDYLYVYRRHPAPTEALRERRAALMQRVGLAMPADLL